MLVRLTTSLQQGAGIDCLDLMIQLLEQKHVTSSVTSHTDNTSQLARCISTACTDFEQQLQVDRLYLSVMCILFMYCCKHVRVTCV